jgi:hypothetical protein
MVSLSLRARMVRRSLRRTAAQKRFPSMEQNSLPILFGNSFPKSGTHLLTQILAGFTQLGPFVESGLPPVLTFEGESGRPRPLKLIAADLARLLPGDIAYGHLHALPDLQTELCREGMAPCFIYRDPRDVVVSHVFYVTDINNKHVHNDYYTKALKDFDERLEVSILGRPEIAVPFPDINERFAPYLGWLERSEVLALRYEDLLERPEAELGRIFDHAVGRGFSYGGERAAAVQALWGAIRPEDSPTFRSGQAGGWKKHFTPKHIKLFKEVGGELLVRLGYEQDLNW